MKSYTNIEQSKKLAEILPIESADMFHLESDSNDVKLMWEHIGPKVTNPCWSLASLIEVLPLGVDIHNITDGHKMYYYVEIYMKRSGKEIYLSTERHENLVDACVEMIIKLHEEKFL